jgi:hypothetical protein
VGFDGVSFVGFNVGESLGAFSNVLPGSSTSATIKGNAPFRVSGNINRYIEKAFELLKIISVKDRASSP